MTGHRNTPLLVAKSRGTGSVRSNSTSALLEVSEWCNGHVLLVVFLSCHGIARQSQGPLNPIASCYIPANSQTQPPAICTMYFSGVNTHPNTHPHTHPHTPTHTCTDSLIHSITHINTLQFSRSVTPLLLLHSNVTRMTTLKKKFQPLVPPLVCFKSTHPSQNINFNITFPSSKPIFLSEIFNKLCYICGTSWRSWSRHCATSRTVIGINLTATLWSWDRLSL